MMSGELADAIAVLERNRELADELGDPEELTRSYINLAEVLDQAGRLADAVEVSRNGVAMARRERIPGVLPMLIAELAARLVRQGGWDEADAILPEAIAVNDELVGRARGRAVRARPAAGAAGRRRRAPSGRCAVVDAAMREAVGSMWTAPTATARADAALWDGRPHDARKVVATELARREEIDDYEATYLAPLIAAGTRAEADLAARARVIGETDACGRAVRDAEEILATGRALIGSDPPPEGALLIELARLETARAAAAASAEDWATLAERWERHGAAFPAAYCRWRAAELVLAGGGPRGTAAEMLAGAHRTAGRLRAEPLRREITDLARRARVLCSRPTRLPRKPGPPSAHPPPRSRSASPRVSSTSCG